MRTLPSSCPGIAPLSKSGLPQLSASITVDGPALVTTTSAALISVAMFSIKPYTCAGNGQCSAASCARRRALRPQTTASCIGIALARSALAICSKGAMPSAPPSSSAVNCSASQPNFRRAAARSRGPARKAAATGSPHTRTRSGARPQARARARATRVGTSVRAARRSNHHACAEARSLTRVTNAGRRSPSPSSTGPTSSGCVLTRTSAG